MSPKLAIVIPFYKISFFEALLIALTKQTNQQFKLYIGDDASLHAPIALIEAYKDRLDIDYIRFEKNIGATNLVGQWQRCLDRVNDEEWVWILPDDDLPSPNTVEAFYKGLVLVEELKIKVFRFPVSIIDRVGNIINHYTSNDPQLETNIAFYERIVRGYATATIGDNIFHKQSLLNQGTFVDFPKAWGSDHATVLCTAQNGNIYFLRDAHLYFRMSGENISSDVTDGLIKLESRIRFCKWLKSHEYIFPHIPSDMFYKHFYWKAEHYILNEWLFDIHLFKKLYDLRVICFDSKNVLPIFKIFLKKLLGVG